MLAKPLLKIYSFISSLDLTKKSLGTIDSYQITIKKIYRKR
jgi:hypothetical protein